MAGNFETALARITSNRAIELRAPAQIVTPTPPQGAMYGAYGYLNSGYAQTDQFDAGSAINGAYLTEIWSFKCVNAIVDTLCKQSFRAGLDPSKPNDWRKNAPLSLLLSKDVQGSPNPMWSSMRFLKYSIAQYIVTGKTAWLKGQNKVTGALELWPLTIQNLHPIPGKPTDATPFIGYDYGTIGSNNYRRLTLDQVIYIYRPSLADWRQPETPVQAGQLGISVKRMLAMYDNAFLKNNATPATLITHPPFAEDDELRAWRDQFTAQFGGYANAGKTYFAESEDADQTGTGGNLAAFNVQKLGLSAKESQFAELREAEISEICVTWGVPRSQLMDSSGAKYTNMANDRVNFWQNRLEPLAGDFSDDINLQLAPIVGPDLGWFDLASVPELRGPAFLLGANAVELIANNVILRDEWREEANLPPADDVDLPPFGVPTDVTVASVSKTNPIPVENVDKLPPKQLAGAGPDPVELPTPSAPPAVPATRDGMDMLAVARQRREDRAAKKITTARIWKTHHITGSDDSPCPICMPFNGKINLDKTPVTDTHPNCNCTNDETAFKWVNGKRVFSKRDDEDSIEVRHAGPDGHQHIPSGHVTTNTVTQLLQTGLNQLLADQKRETSMRLGGGRGRRMQTRSQQSSTALFDADYWEPKVVAAIAPLVGEERSILLGSSYSSTVTGALNSMPNLLAESVADVLGSSMASFIQTVLSEIALPTEATA